MSEMTLEEIAREYRLGSIHPSWKMELSDGHCELLIPRDPEKRRQRFDDRMTLGEYHKMCFAAYRRTKEELLEDLLDLQGIPFEWE